MPKKHFILYIFLFTLSYIPNAQAVSVAVFPVEDLSNGLNGVNFELTSKLSEELEKKGLDVISGDDVVSFLVRNRIRRLGLLDTNCILQARDELGADVILVGSSYTSREKMVHPERKLATALGYQVMMNNIYWALQNQNPRRIYYLYFGGTA